MRIRRRAVLSVFVEAKMEHQMVTKEENAKLEADLKAMIARRPVISKAIAEAREKGDLRENADYHAAREEYSLNESHIKHMEERLRAVTVVDTSEVPEDMVFLGSTVKLTGPWQSPAKRRSPGRLRS